MLTSQSNKMLWEAKKTDGLEIAVSRQKNKGCSPATDYIPVSHIKILIPYLNLVTPFSSAS